MRIQSTTRRRHYLAASLLGVLAAALAVTLSGPGATQVATATTTANTGGTAAGNTVASTPIVTVPAPTSIAPAAPALTTPAPQPTMAAPATTAAPRPPALSKTDKKAIEYVKFHWEGFVAALQQHNGTRLTKAQLTMPKLVVVPKPGCPPDSRNVLGPKSKKALNYCKGVLQLVPAVFLDISELGQLKVVASAFLYQALAKTTKAQRAYPDGRLRNDTQVLGCLQASLSYSLVANQTIATEDDAWAVMREGTTGGDMHNSYYATLDNNGRWN